MGDRPLPHIHVGIYGSYHHDDTSHIGKRLSCSTYQWDLPDVLFLASLKKPTEGEGEMILRIFPISSGCLSLEPQRSAIRLTKRLVIEATSRRTLLCDRRKRPSEKALLLSTSFRKTQENTKKGTC